MQSCWALKKVKICTNTISPACNNTDLPYANISLCSLYYWQAFALYLAMQISMNVYLIGNNLSENLKSFVRHWMFAALVRTVCFYGGGGLTQEWWHDPEHSHLVISSLVPRGAASGALSTVCVYMFLKEFSVRRYYCEQMPLSSALISFSSHRHIVISQC